MTDQDTHALRRALPANSVRVNLPFSEACIHMEIAGQQRWAAKVDSRRAQIFTESGARYGAPVALAAAGLDPDGEPNPRCEPTGIELELPALPGERERQVIVIPDPPAGAVLARPVTGQPTVQRTLAQILAVGGGVDRLALGDASLPIARLHVTLAVMDGPDQPLTAATVEQLTAAAAFSRRLAAAGWCCVLNIDGDLLELIARRRVATIDDAILDLLELDGTGSLWLDDPQETESLAHVELGAPAHRPLAAR